MAEEKQQKTSQEPSDSSSPALPRFHGKIGGSTPTGKMEWPELVGETAEAAERKIKEEKPGAQVQVVPPDHFVTMDYRPNRVRLFVDDSNKVHRTPRIG